MIGKMYKNVAYLYHLPIQHGTQISVFSFSFSFSPSKPLWMIQFYKLWDPRHSVAEKKKKELNRIEKKKDNQKITIKHKVILRRRKKNIYIYI